jgi:hypothetical protein
MEMMAGFFSGKIAAGFFRISTQTVGLRTTKTASTVPVSMLATAPAVVNPST